MLMKGGGSGSKAYTSSSSNFVEFPAVSEEQDQMNNMLVEFRHHHPRHGPLSRICLPDLFTCSGCKEYGAGNRFSCQQCDYQLHEFCALSPPDGLKAHPFHSQHRLLLFYSTPPPPPPTTTTTTTTTSVSVSGKKIKYSYNNNCHICANPIKGFSFRCGVCTFQMHPCCAMLTTEINVPSVHPHQLRMLPVLLEPEEYYSYYSKKKTKRPSTGGGRVYRCTVCEYHVHAAFLKNVKNGLMENGYNNHKPGSTTTDSNKPSMLGTAARLASQVLVEFLGGIIEGIGEGVGEAFVQNINAKAAPSHLNHHHHRP